MFNKFFNTLLAFLFCLVIALVIFTSKSNAQVFDPLSKSLGGTMQGHILWADGIPVITGTGSPSLAAGSSNIAGIVTAGASATSVVITFGSGGFIGAVPSCVVTTQSGPLAAFAYVITKTTITITQTATSGNLINYRCDVQA